MNAHANDLCQRVLAAVDLGLSRTKVAMTFWVSLATSKRLLALRATALPTAVQISLRGARVAIAALAVLQQRGRDSISVRRHTER